MESIGAFEAKTNLSALLVRVENGESIVITQHGRPVARLVTESLEHPPMTVDESIAGLLEFKKAHPMSRLEIKSLIEAGRKY